MKKFFLLASLTAALYMTACNDGTTGTTTSGDTKDSTKMTQEDKEERNKNTVMSSINIFANGGKDVDAVLKDVTADAIEYNDGSMPTQKGRDSIAKGMKEWLASFDSKGSNLEAVADGNMVYVSGEWTITWKNDFMGAKANGKSTTYRDVDMFTLNDDGKITSHRATYPGANVMKALWVPMPK